MIKLQTPSKEKINNKKAFTLVELVVVVVVLGIIAALAIGTFQTVRGNSAENIALRSAEQVVRNAASIGAFKGEILDGETGNINIDLAGNEIITGNGATYNGNDDGTYAGKVIINQNGECAEAIIGNNGDITVVQCGGVVVAGSYDLYDKLGMVEDFNINVNSGVKYGQVLTAPSDGVFSEIQFMSNAGAVNVTAALYSLAGGDSSSYTTVLLQSQTFTNITASGQVSLDTPGFVAQSGVQYIVTVSLNVNQTNSVQVSTSGNNGYIETVSGSGVFQPVGGDLAMLIEYTPQ
jgi:prepilin-type N-terminal cleavage/methylation domain-containing protein